MRQTYTMIAAFLLFASAHAQNSCSTALVIAPGAQVVPGITGLESPVPICANTGPGATAGMWYRFTSPVDTAITITTTTSGVDTRFHVYTGSCGTLVCVVGDDDSGAGSTSEAMFNAVAGTAYTIAFDDRWTAEGFTFQLLEAPVVILDIEPIVFTTDVIPDLAGSILTVVDMNGDHLDDAVVASSANIKVALQQPDGVFMSTLYSFPPTQHPPSFSIAAGDMDNNGRMDLLYGGGGPTFLLMSDDGTTFNEWSNDTYLFAQRTNMADIDNDGFLDGFYCNDFGINHYYFSDGVGSFTEASGSLSVLSGNYGSIWIDFDGDGDVDMYNTKCGGGNIDELYRNDGGGQFTNVAPEMGFADAHSAWSTAWGDFDNDGDLDAFVGKSGSPVHKLMRNDGTVFTNITIGSGVELAASSIEWRTHDFNNDGFLDILGQSQILYGDGEMTFMLFGSTPYNGPIGDLNNDGFLDMVSGSNVAYNNGNDNKWLKVSLVGTVSNRSGVGARVTVVTAQGQQIREIISGDGCRYMSSLNAHFGIGANEVIDQVQVRWPSGIVDVIEAPLANGTLVVEEGLSTRIPPALTAGRIALFPNPAQDRLSVVGTLSSSVRISIADMAGRVVLRSAVIENSVDVSGLSMGTYLVTLVDGHQRTHTSFVKE